MAATATATATAIAAGNYHCFFFCDRRAKSPPQNSPALGGRAEAPLSRKGATSLLSLRYREGVLSLRYREGMLSLRYREGAPLALSLSLCLFISLLAFESHVAPVGAGVAGASGFGHLSTTFSPFAMALVFRKAGTATEKGPRDRPRNST